MTNINGRLQKNGGNVASYFCTPEGRVVHAVLGPVPAAVLEREARFAAENYTHAAAQSDFPAERKEWMVMAHKQQLASNDSDWGARRGKRATEIHQLLIKQPLAPLEEIYEYVFQDLLGERVSFSNETVGAAVYATQVAKVKNLPILYIVDRGEDTYHRMLSWRQMVQQYRGGTAVDALLSRYVAIAIPLEDLPALSNELAIDPYNVPGSATPQFIITHSDGRQIDAFSGWLPAETLAARLGQGLATAMRGQADAYPTQVAEVLTLLKRIERSRLDRTMRAQIRRAWMELVEEYRAAETRRQ